MVVEKDGIMSTKDSSGNLVITYMATRKSAIVDLEDATEDNSGLLSSEDKSKINKIAYTIGCDDSGYYIEGV